MKISYKLLIISCFFFFFISCLEKNANKEPFQNEQLKLEEGHRQFDIDTVEFTKYRNYIIIHTLIKDSIPAKLLLDTGAGGGLYLDSAFTRREGLISAEYYGDQTTFEGRSKYIRALNILREEVIPVSANNIIDSLDHTVIFDLKRIIGSNHADGMLGLKFIEKYIMEINFGENLIIFHKLEGYKKPVNVKTIPMTFDERARRFFIDIQFNINDSIQFNDKAFVDLGFGKNSISFGPIKVKKNNLIKHTSEITINKKMGTTVTRENIEGFYGRIKSIGIDKLFIDTPRVQLNTSTRGVSSSNLIIVGNYIFSRYNRVIFDFSQSKIYIDD